MKDREKCRFRAIEEMNTSRCYDFSFQQQCKEYDEQWNEEEKENEDSETEGGKTPKKKHKIISFCSG